MDGLGSVKSNHHRNRLNLKRPICRPSNQDRRISKNTARTAQDLCIVLKILDLELKIPS